MWRACRQPQDVNKLLEFEATETDVDKLPNPVKLEMGSGACWVASEGNLFLAVTGTENFQCLMHRET